MNCSLEKLIRTNVGNKQKQWDLLLPHIKLAFNTSINRYTIKTPFEIVYSKVPNHVFDHVILPKLRESSNAHANDLPDETSHEVQTKFSAFNAKI